MYMYYFLGFQLAGENGTREVIFIEDNKEERRNTKDEQKKAKELERKAKEDRLKQGQNNLSFGSGWRCGLPTRCCSQSA